MATQRKIVLLTLLYLLLFSLCHLKAQSTFLSIQNYSADDYHAGLQNWDIEVNNKGDLFVANSMGLLSYDGSDWELHELPSKQSILAVHLKNDTLYTSGDYNLGYWLKDDYGRYQYTSLETPSNPSIRNDFYWSIADDGKNIYFQSYSKIVEFTANRNHILTSKCHLFLHQQEEHIYVHKLYEDIYGLENGKFFSIVPREVLKDKDEMRFMFSLDKKQSLIGMKSGIVFKMDSEGTIFPMKKISDSLSPYNIECGLLTEEGNIIIGTIGGGIFIFSKDGELIEHIDISSGLISNVVRAICMNDHSLWVSTDNGLSKISINPLLRLWKINRELGVLSDVVCLKDTIFLATSQGLYKTDNTLDISSKLHRVHEIVGETFSLSKRKEKLLCGSDAGIYEFSNNRWQQISNINGITDIVSLKEENGKYCIAQSYLYMNYLKLDDHERWKIYSKVSDFPSSFSKIVPEDKTHLWALHLQKGIFKININEDLSSISEYHIFDKQTELKDYKKINIIKRSNHQILFFSPDGAFRYEKNQQHFESIDSITKYMHSLGAVDWVESAGKDQYWFFKGHEMFLVEINQQNEVKELAKTSLLSYNLSPVYDVKRIFPLTENLSLLNTTEGIAVLNKELLLKKSHKKGRIVLKSVSYKIGNKKIYLPLRNTKEFRVPSKATDIRIQVKQSRNNTVLLTRYRFNDYKQEWSEWEKNGNLNLVKMPVGSHIIEIQSHNDADSILVNLQIYLPFYLRSYAIFCYVAILFYLIFFWYRMRTKRARAQLILKHDLVESKQQRKLVTLEKRELEARVDQQKKEIQDKLRNVCQKKELLISIDKELGKLKLYLKKEEPQKIYTKIKKIISRDIREESDFMLFQNYYQEINEEFILSMKMSYPDLTPQELRFAALLRSNLSTKEIALILNITQRTVDLKKYRLKKKLNIEDMRLNDFILTFKI